MFDEIVWLVVDVFEFVGLLWCLGEVVVVRVGYM